MSTAHNGGLGPWFCSLYFSLASNPKKQTDLRVHTYPLLLERLMNGPKANSVGTNSTVGGWVLIMVIGYFEQWDDALAFYTLWSKQTRGKTRRIQRGLDLFYRYNKSYKLRMWLQPHHRKRALKLYKRAYSKPRAVPTSSSADSIRQHPTPSELGLSKRNLLLSKVHKIQTHRVKRQKQ